MVESILVEPSPSRQADAVELLTAVADPVRWRLMVELARRGTRCVCDLQPVGGVAPNVLSYHLKVLRDAGLVTAARRGRWMACSSRCTVRWWPTVIRMLRERF